MQFFQFNFYPMKKALPLLLASVALLAHAALGQNATTTPVGVMTLRVRGKGATNANSFISLNLARPTAFQGVVGTKSLVGGQSVITFSSDLFTVDQFNGTGKNHYAQLTSGSNNGLVSQVVATTANSITLADDINDVLTDGTTTFKIVPYWTLATAFPNGAGLNGGTAPANADNVTILPAVGTALVYFYNTTYSQWRRGTTDSSDVIIPPGSGLLITRKFAGDVSFQITGAVNVGPTEAAVGAGSATGSRNTVISNPYPVASVTLATSGLYTGSASTGVVGGTAPAAADNVVIYDPITGVPSSYFYNTTYSQWRRGTTDSSNVTIPDGVAVMITRKANRGEFSWYIPQPSMNLN